MSGIYDRERDLDETARMILLDSPGCSLLHFGRELRDNCGDDVGLSDIGTLWRKYRGFDGRASATHDVVTGERLRGIR